MVAERISHKPLHLGIVYCQAPGCDSQAAYLVCGETYTGSLVLEALCEHHAAPFVGVERGCPTASKPASSEGDRRKHLQATA